MGRTVFLLKCDFIKKRELSWTSRKKRQKMAPAAGFEPDSTPLLICARTQKPFVKPFSRVKLPWTLFNILPFDDSSNALTLKKGRKKVAKSFPFLPVRSSVFILSVSTKLSLKQQKIAEIPHPSWKIESIFQLEELQNTSSYINYFVAKWYSLF